MGILIKRGDPIDHILNVYLPTESADNLPDFTHYMYKIHTLFQNNDTVYNMAVGDFKANLMKQSIFCSELIKFCHENDYVLGDQGKLPGQKKLTGENYLLKLCQTICTQLMFHSKILF